MEADLQLIWMHVDDAASALGISVRTMYRRVQRGEYLTEKRNGRLFVGVPLSEDVSEPLAEMAEENDTYASAGRDVISHVTDPEKRSLDMALREHDPLAQELEILRLKLRHAEEQHDAARREHEAAQRESETIREMLGSDVEHLRGLTTQQGDTIQNLTEEIKGLTIALHHEQGQLRQLEADVDDKAEDDEPKKPGFLRRAFMGKPKPKRRRKGKFARVGPS